MRAGVAAEFRSADDMLAALTALRADGYRALECYSPFEVPDTDAPLGLARPRLPKVVFAGGLLGAILGYGIQWYADVVAYRQLVGGRPAHAVPAFIPSTFEAAVLGAALTAFIGVLVVLGLPKLWDPMDEVEGFERASADRFWVAVDATDRRYDPERSRQELAALGPVRVVRVGAPP